MHCIAGIDPGLTGAVAVLSGAANGLRLLLLDMPVLKIHVGRKVRNRIDLNTLLTLMIAVKTLDVELAVLEDVGGITGQSASAAFVFGQCCGFTEAAAATAKLPLQLVTPQVWQKKFGVKGRTYKERKQSVRLAAGRAFPEQTDWGPMTAGRADAALIALYGARYVQSWA